MHFVFEDKKKGYKEYMDFTNNILLTKEAINILARILVEESQSHDINEKTWKNIMWILIESATHVTQK